MTKKSNYKIELRKKKFFSIPYNTQIFSMFAIILIIGAPALIASIDSKDSTQNVYFEKDLSSYFANGEFDGYWGDQPDVTVSYNGLVNGNTVVITADNDDYTGSFAIKNLDISILTDLAKLEVISSEIVDVGYHTAIILDKGYRIESSISEDGVLIFSPSSLDLIQISNSDKCVIQFKPVKSSVDPVSVIELEFTPHYQYTIAYGEIIIGMTGGLLLICALFATPWFDVNGLNIKKKRRA